MNIVELLLKLLGSGDLPDKIASLLGIGRDQAGKAVGAAVPTLLAGLLGTASKPQGASQLLDILSRQQPQDVDDVPALLNQGSQLGLGESNPLSSLLGSAGLGQIAGALSKFTGVGESGIGKLLGMLTPVLLGVLGKQAKGLDASGLANLLEGQKSNITSALPSGLGSLLSSAVPSLGGLLGGASQAANSAVQATTAAAGSAARHAEAAASPLKRLIIPLILLALAAFLLLKVCRKTPDAVNSTANAVGQAVTTAAESASFTSQVTPLIADATAALSSIKDEASANTALPKLGEINSKLTGLKSVWAGLPAPVKNSVSETLRPLIAKLREAVAPVLALPVVGQTVKPAVDQLLDTLDGFAAAP